MSIGEWSTKVDTPVVTVVTSDPTGALWKSAVLIVVCMLTITAASWWAGVELWIATVMGIVVALLCVPVSFFMWFYKPNQVGLS